VCIITHLLQEHILQICEAFAGMSPGRADVLRRALVKEKTQLIAEISGEFHRSAQACGHEDAVIAQVWELVSGFRGYAFNKAHSTAYGVEAWQAAWLKHYHPAEFMAGVLTNGKGFSSPLVYVLECHRLGLKLLPPCLNDPGPGFQVRDGAIRVPVSAIKGLSGRTLERLLTFRGQRGPFVSVADFQEAVQPTPEELETLIRAGAADRLGLSRTRLFWEAQVCRRRQQDRTGAQGWLLAPPVLEFPPALPGPAEPGLADRLAAEMDLLGYTVSGHPLEMHPDIAWDTYCPVDRLHEFTGQTVVLCGLTVVSRVHSQSNGETMKFLTLADRTGMIEAELFGPIYRRFGLATVRYPVLEVTATYVVRVIRG
jgi:DNA polymerase III alpha subunit